VEIEYRKCTQDHIKLIVPQEGDVMNQVMYLSPDFAEYLSGSFALSAWIGSKCIAAAGICTVNKYRGIGWSFLGADSGPYMRQLTKKVKAIIDNHPLPRIEMTVATDFHTGHRWAKLLGFECEAARMRKHGMLGNDETLYARIK